MIRGVRIHEFGGPEVLRIQDVEVEEPREGEVRIRIRAIGINRTEITLRSGRLPAKPPLPTKIGFEAAGEIEAIGPGVKGLAIGDRVALVPAYAASRYGLYGESSLAPARSLIGIPVGVSFEQAAATWAAYGTAWAGLVAVGRLAAGQTVVLPAASSSVGLAAIQIANRLGARPIALTRTSAKADDLRAYGAAGIVATEERDVVSEIKRLTTARAPTLYLTPSAARLSRSSWKPRLRAGC
jgi:NADPH:quinone reductase-like Zn-dependent oxidoreductase